MSQVRRNNPNCRKLHGIMLRQRSRVQPSNRNADKILLVSAIHYEAYYLCRFNLAPVLPVLIAELGLAHSEAGALASMLFISYALILLPAGVLGDIVGPRVVITLGAVMSAVTNLLFSYSTSFRSMMILQFANGLGQGMAWGPLIRLMTNWYPRERMSFVMSLLSIPPALGPSLAWLEYFIKIGAIAGLSSVILVMLLGQPRIFYTMAKDGLLPPVFSAVHPKFRTPWVAQILTGVIAMLLAGLFPIGLLYLCQSAVICVKGIVPFSVSPVAPW
jgi:sugar phosphate permease